MRKLFVRTGKLILAKSARYTFSSISIFVQIFDLDTVTTRVQWKVGTATGGAATGYKPILTFSHPTLSPRLRRNDGGERVANVSVVPRGVVLIWSRSDV